MATNFNFANTGNAGNNNSGNSSATSTHTGNNASNNSGNQQQQITNPNSSLPTRNVNPLTNSEKDSETNALAGLANILNIGQGGGQRGNDRSGRDDGQFDDTSLQRGSRNLDGANSQNNGGNNQQQSGQDTQQPRLSDAEQTTAAISGLLRQFRGDPLHEFDINSIHEGFRNSDMEPLITQINASLDAAITRTLQVVLSDLAPGIINAAVSRSVTQASDTISTNSVWGEFAEKYPDLVEAETLIRPQLEQAYRNTKDKKRAIDAIVAVYGNAGNPNRNRNRSRDDHQSTAPFDIDNYFGN